jgi:glycosyltransferase involved in cell wall biosynthesis
MPSRADRVSARLRIGVDADNLMTDRRGIGRYVRALVGRWLGRDGDVDVTLLVSHPFPGMLTKRLAASLDVPSVAVANRSYARRHGFDVVWHPWNGIFFRTDCRDVATIHDVWPFVDAPAENPTLAEQRQTPFLHAAARAARIVTDSRFSKSEIVRHLGVGEARIEVIPLGVDEALLEAKPPHARVAGAERYVLFVGEPEARKDLSTLLRAMGALPESLRATTALVVAGRRPASATIPPGVRVDFAGEVDDARLASLYAGAAAFAFPSVYEGFGLPVLEAMALGAPVVASDAASVPEAGGDAALYFPARDAAALAARLERVITDPSVAGELRTKGRRRAAEMSWDRCASATLDVLRGSVAVAT